MPLPTTKVIPDGWSDRHRPTAAATMTSRCVITRTAGGTTGPDGVWTPGASAAVYTGPCRVQALATSQRMTTGEAQVTARRYLVAITHDAAVVAVDDIVEITDSVDDGLIGTQLRVADVRYGSEQWQRDLIAEEVT